MDPGADIDSDEDLPLINEDDISISENEIHILENIDDNFVVDPETIDEIDPDSDDSSWATESQHTIPSFQEQAEQGKPEALPSALRIPMPTNRWSTINKLINRQLGTRARYAASNFQYDFTSAMRTVRRMTLMHKIEKDEDSVNALHMHPSGNYLLSGCRNSAVEIWTAAAIKKWAFNAQHFLDLTEAKFMQTSGHDLLILTCGQIGEVRLHKIPSGEGQLPSEEIALHNKEISSAATPIQDPTIFFTAGCDGEVHHHDLRSGNRHLISVIGENGDPVPLSSINMNPVRSHEFVVSGEDNQVRVYDARNLQRTLRNFWAPYLLQARGIKYGDITCSIYNAIGTEILSSRDDGVMYLYDTNKASNKPTHSYTGHSNQIKGRGRRRVNFFGGRSEFVVSGSDCLYTYFWHKDTEAIVNTCFVNDSECQVEVHPSIPALYTTGWDSQIRVWMPLRRYENKMKTLRTMVAENEKTREMAEVQRAYELPPNVDLSRGLSIDIFNPEF